MLTNKLNISLLLTLAITFTSNDIIAMSTEAIAMAGIGICTQLVNKQSGNFDENNEKIVQISTNLITDKAFNKWKKGKHKDDATKEKFTQLQEIEIAKLKAKNSLCLATMQVPGKGLVEAAKFFAQAQVEKTKAQNDKQTAAIKSAVLGQTIMNGITQIINDPKTIIMLTAIIFGTYYASKLGYAHIKQQMERPQVIEETSLYSGLEKLKNFVITPPPLKAQDIDEIVASPEIKQKINELATILKTARQTNETMPNILFYGPPGTGKTLTARALAAQSGLDYVMFSGTSLTKLERGKDRAELDKIFAFAKKSPKGVLVFIDEAESFLGNRENTTTSEQSRELTQAFLEKVPKPSDKNIVFVFATNRRNILDSAVESRISEVVHMPYPTDREKLQLMELFIKKEVVNAGVPIEEGFTQRKQELIDLMDKKFVGRTIEEMTQKFRRKVRLGRHVSLSYEIARGVIEETNKKLVSQRKRASSLS